MSRGMLQVAKVILLNTRGEVLLLRRGSDPTLRDASRWDLLGVPLKPGETADAAMLRSVQEEICCLPTTYAKLCQHQTRGVRHHVFTGLIDEGLVGLHMRRGHVMAFFSPEQALRELELSECAQRSLSKYVGATVPHGESRAENPSVTIREASIADACALALLATQLGYGSQPEQLANRLRSLPPSQGVVLVAVDGTEVVGWIHVNRLSSLLVDAAAEILALVVGEGQRGRGIGLVLLRAAEAWAVEAGCSTMFVRSNIVRQRAHEFYTQHGYRQTKTSLTLTKPLAGSDAERS